MAETAPEAALAALKVTEEPAGEPPAAPPPAAAKPAPVKLFKKRTMKKGDKLNFPRKGSTVKVQYVGRLLNADGTEGDEFDSTWNPKKKSQAPLVVKAGVGKLIPGWDTALLELSVGERAHLTIPPEGAYGAKGMPPKIPPNATLVFEVELVAIMD